MEENVAISVRKVNKTFRSGEAENHVLHDIDLDFHSGEICFIVGPSGCGKTTFISIIGGVLDADDTTEQVRVFDHDVMNLPDKDMARFRQQNIGFIFQQHNLVPTLTVQENAAVPLLIQKRPWAESMENAAGILDKVGLGNFTHQYPKTISGGQQQRVTIARALVNEPRLMICDEPTASLDGETGRQVMELLADVAQHEDRCVIVVTHDERIFEFADRIVEMEDGRIKNITNNQKGPAE